MKKIYSKPETHCIRIQVQHLICESISDTNVGLEYGGTTEANEIMYGNSRRGGFWDDED